MTDSFVIVDVPPPNFVIIEQAAPNYVIVEEGGGGGGTAGVLTFDGRFGVVGFELADAERIFTANGQLLIGTGTETGVLLDGGTDGYVLTMVSGAPAWAAGGGGGGGSFPDFTGSGSPEGVVSATVGKWYQDTSGTTEGLYVKRTGTGDTGWFNVGANDATVPGLYFPGNTIVGLLTTGNKSAFLSDAGSQAGSGQGIYWNSSTTDGDQNAQIVVGVGAAFSTNFNPDGSVQFPGPIQLDGVVDGGGATIYALNDNPNSNITPNQQGDICIDALNAHIWQSTDGTISGWVQVGGGAGSVPTYTGSGSPEGVQSGSPGDTYQDTATGALYWKEGSSSNTGWTFGVSRTADVGGTPYAGIGIHPSNGLLYIVAESATQVAITDADAIVSSGNGLYWVSTGTDGSQFLEMNLGPSGAFVWEWESSGTTTFPGPLTIDVTVDAGSATIFAFAGNPNSNVTALAAGDVCVDTSTPAIWQATGSGTGSWVQVGVGGGGSFPTSTGSGSPETVVTGNWGDTYQDTSSGAVYYYNGGGATNTGWAAGVGHANGLHSSPGAAGIGFDAFGQTASLILVANTNESVVITDVAGAQGSTNGIYVTSGGADYLQTIRFQTGGPSTFNTWHLNVDGSTVFPTTLTLGNNTVDATIFTSSGDPTGSVSALEAGDICIDAVTPALWQATASGSSSWVQLGSGGGGGSFPDFAVSGQPEGAQVANVGQWFEDTSGGTPGLYVFNGTDGSDTGWVSVMGIDTTIPGYTINSETSYISGYSAESIFISDVDAMTGSGNSIAWNSTGTDGDQYVNIQLGASGTFVTHFNADGNVVFPGPIQLDYEVDGGAASIFSFNGNPNTFLTSNNKGDLCIDPNTPALWLASAGSSTTWTQVGAGGGGGGSFPDFTGSGNPEGVQTADYGQWYEDTSGSSAGIYVFLGGNGTSTGWISVGGDSDTVAGISYPNAAILLAPVGDSVFISDIAAMTGTNNALAWNANTDGDQTLDLVLGSSAQYNWVWNADGTTTFPGPIFLDTTVDGGGVALFSYAGDPNTHVSANAKGDICFDVTTPGIWLASTSGNSGWIDVTTGGGGGGSFPDYSGSGSPEGVQSAFVGQWYEDTSGSTTGLFLKGTAAGAPAYVVGDTIPTFPVAVVTGVNDEFVYTPIATGIPDTFTIASGTYYTWGPLLDAVDAALDSSSNLWSSIGSADHDQEYAQASIRGASVTLPLTVATGVNDTFVFTPITTGTPETFTMTASTYTTMTSLRTAFEHALGTSSEQFATWIAIVDFDGDNLTVVGDDNADGDILSAGPTDVLADLGFTSPATLVGGFPAVMRLTMDNPGVADNGDTISFGANDVAAQLGFTENPNTFVGGDGGTDTGWMQIGGNGGFTDTPVLGLNGDDGSLNLLADYGSIYISDTQAFNGSGGGIRWYAGNGDYDQEFQVSIADRQFEGTVYFDVFDGVGFFQIPGALFAPLFNQVGAAYVMTGNESVVISDSDVTLPNPENVSWGQYFIKDSGAGTCVIHAFGAELIDGTTGPLSMSALSGIQLVSDGTAWWIIATAAI